MLSGHRSDGVAAGVLNTGVNNLATVVVGDVLSGKYLHHTEESKPATDCPCRLEDIV